MQAPTDRRPRPVLVIAALLAVLPATGLAVASVWWSAAATQGGGLWPPVSLTLPEAAASGDVAELVRMIGFGADPNTPARVRPGLLYHAAVTVSPLEAAAQARKPQVVLLLIARGALPTEADLIALRCATATHPDAEIDAILERLGEGRGPACDTDESPR